MSHLSPAELMDVVEGTASHDLMAHATTCGWCRRNVDDARAGAELARRDAAAEPSPLFWSHLSRRIQDAAMSEGHAGRAWLPATWHLRPLTSSLAVVLVVIVSAAVWTVQGPGVPPRLAATAVVVPDVASDPSSRSDAIANDASWNLVSHMAEGVIRESGSTDALTAPVGSIDRAIPTLTESERAELARLLRERLGES